MDVDEIAKPALIEPGVRFFLHQSLKQCNILREEYYNLVFNIMVFIGLLLFFGLILVYKYKGRLSTSEMQQKNKEKQQYLLSKIQNFQENKRKSHQELITGLPNWENEYDTLNSI
tara:strand:+ start:547 stop:891 length:345 start_codon:yes stop_codon:yes gene_type:complete